MDGLVAPLSQLGYLIACVLAVRSLWLSCVVYRGWP
jgi:hypothetical protein